MAGRVISTSDRPTPGPWIVRGEADEGAPAPTVVLGVEPATDTAPGGWPYLIRPDGPLLPGGSLPHVAIGIQRLADARLMATAPELAEALFRLITSPDLLAPRSPETRGALAVAWPLLVRAAPHLEL